MKKEEIDQLLQTIPGAQRAADGVILQNEDGSIIHFQGIISSTETEGLTPEETFFLAFCAKREILRMRSITSAHDYLLRTRAMAIVDSPRSVRVMRKRRDIYESPGRPWALTHYYHSLDFYHKSYIALLSRSHAKTLKSIPAGLVAIVEANAACIASFAGEIVVVSESLRHFYYFMTIAVFGENFGISIADRVSALCIAYRVMNQSEALDFDLDSRGELPRTAEKKVQALVADQMQFTFGHEYAHYLCGHFSSTNAPLPGNRETARTYAHDLEFEADAQAVKLARQTPAAANRIAHGGMFVLIFLELLYRLRDQYSLCKLPVSETHPMPIDRLYALQRSLGSSSPMSLGDINHSLDVCSQLSDAFSQFLKGSLRSDILTFYGSVYLPSYVSKPRQDRVDF